MLIYQVDTVIIPAGQKIDTYQTEDILEAPAYTESALGKFAVQAFTHIDGVTTRRLLGPRIATTV